jgi:hypothetical protein
MLVVVYSMYYWWVAMTYSRLVGFNDGPRHNNKLSMGLLKPTNQPYRYQLQLHIQISHELMAGI